MSKIISFAGRMRSGKTELAKVCEEYGYKKLYFALPLKQMCAELLGLTIDELNELKNNNTEINIVVDEDFCKFISEKANIPLSHVKSVCLGKKIINVRQMLQFIGTDLIRKYDNDWHVKKIRSIISNHDDVNYVIDDVRFPNEKTMVEEMGGKCWYVIRPNLKEVSHHASEESLKSECFGDNVIINDDTLEALKNKWKNLMY